MQVLDDQQHRRCRAGRLEQAHDRAGAALLPRRIVHRLVQRTATLGLRQADDVAQERLLFREPGMLREELLRWPQASPHRPLAAAGS